VLELISVIARSRMAFAAAAGLLCFIAAATRAASAPQLSTASPADIQVVAQDFGGGEGPSVLPDGEIVFMGGSGGLLGIAPGGQLQTLVSPLAAVGTAPARKEPNILYAARMDITRIAGGPGTPLKPRPAGSTAPAGAILRVDLSTKAVSELYTLQDGQLLVGPNKLVVDDWGDIWFSDVLEGSVYWARADGTSIRRVLAFPAAHGIALAPDHRTLYVSSQDRLIALEITGRGQIALRGDEPHVQDIATLDHSWNVDGIRTEADGNIVMACWGAGVIVLSPRGVKISQTELPGLEVTNLVFGGGDRRTLYLTAHVAGDARGSKSGRLVALKWPRPGAAL
jgi:gluconolactonase